MMMHILLIRYNMINSKNSLFIMTTIWTAYIILGKIPLSIIVKTMLIITLTMRYFMQFIYYIGIIFSDGKKQNPAILIYILKNLIVNYHIRHGQIRLCRFPSPPKKNAYFIKKSTAQMKREQSPRA